MLTGVFLYIFAIPLLESIASYCCQWLELQRSKLIVKQYALKKELTDDDKDAITTEEVRTNVIGFQSTSASDYDDDDEEYEDDE